MPELENDAHERFAEEYLKDLNATQAYLRVYPDSGYSAAQSSGSVLLSNPMVADRVAELKTERSKRVQVSLDEILQELKLLAFSDPGWIVIDEHGHFNLSPTAPPGAARAVASVTHKIYSNGGDFTTAEVKYQFWNKNDALKQLMAHVAHPVKQSEDEDGNGVLPLDVIRKAIRKAEERRRLKSG
jgi:hypothetical protein